MQWFALPKRYVIGRITWLLPYKVGTRLTDASVGSIFPNSEGKELERDQAEDEMGIGISDEGTGEV